MSAGICIMNKQAIALAADSAVTIGDHVAIHNSANKLFSLSKVAPVGLIIYANASLMSVPMEIIVKEYKHQLENKTFDSLNDYVEDFKSYIEANSDLFRFEHTEGSYILNVIFCFWNILEEIYSNFAEKRHISKDERTKAEGLPLATEAYEQFEKIFNRFEKCDSNYYDYLKREYEEIVLEKLDCAQEFSWLDSSLKKKVVDLSLRLFDTDFDYSNYIGVCIAGYGNKEIYPSLMHLHISGCINGKLRCFTRQAVSITETMRASIIPLAQTDVMETFLFGINDRFLQDLKKEIPQQIGECISKIDDSDFAPGKKGDVHEKLKSLSANIINHIVKMASENYMNPIFDSVATLPIDELSLLAESMINITSIRRKVALDDNIGTVGGPIDVAIISKGDGFIWLKRKHYFEGKNNPQYFYSHFEKCERREGDDEL